MTSKRIFILLFVQLPYLLDKLGQTWLLLLTTSAIRNANCAVSSSGYDGKFSSDSHHDQQFPKPGGALPVTSSHQMLSQLPGQYQQSYANQNSRHSNHSPHYLPNSNVPTQKTTLVRNPEFVLSSTPCKRGGDFEAPIPKRICRLNGIHQGYDVQSQGVEDR
jgi:hypothetical protein